LRTSTGTHAGTVWLARFASTILILISQFSTLQVRKYYAAFASNCFR
jgi:hypothetical protein